MFSNFGSCFTRCWPMNSLFNRFWLKKKNVGSNKIVGDDDEFVKIEGRKKQNNLNYNLSNSIKQFPAPEIIIERINTPKHSREEQEVTLTLPSEINITEGEEEEENEGEEGKEKWKIKRKGRHSSVVLINKEIGNNQNEVLSKSCAQLCLSVQYSEQKEFLILILNELVKLEDLGVIENQNEEKAMLQLRLALLIPDSEQKTFQKFRTKFRSFAGQLKINFGETFAFNCDKSKLANSFVRFRLYKKYNNDIRRPQCIGLAFLQNFLIDLDSIQKVQKHFLQFRRPLNKPKSVKGSMSLFPSLLSLSNHQNHHQLKQNQQQTIPSSPTKNNNTSTDSPIENQQQQQRKSSTNSSPSHQRFCGNNSQQSVTPRSASGSRRGSTVDDRGAFCTLPQQGGNQPEVLVSLCYFDTQNRLVVGVNKAAAIGTGRKKESGSDVSGQEVSIRISAFSAEGVEIGRQKSAWTKANPTGEVQFNDAQASFQISRHELEECAVQVDMFGLNNSAWPPLLRRKQKIGTLMLSDRRENDCSSSADAQAHWQEMIQGMGLTLDKWHLLN
uniref:Uncharacterized protein n=1 Tax=Meloidogyne enterolobii TaxID=390850 RepID=A0A6V7WUE9_MELEN|nr:unnamed protein product [Meloidogyne enterolobii]